VVELSRIALEAGACGITVHPRPDERHIRRHDVDSDVLEAIRTARSVKKGTTKNVRRKDVVNLLRTVFHL